MSQAIGVFGLGLIGTALAGRLLQAGRPVEGHDPDGSRAETLGEMGGRFGRADDIWKNRLVFSCVFDTDQLAALIEQAPSVDTGCLVSISTCDPARMEALGRNAAEKGWRLIEAPISGTSRQLSLGEAVFLVGGAPEDVATVSPVLDGLGRTYHHVGPLGAGNRAKLAVNLILGLNRAALAEGLVFAQRMGLAPQAFLELAQDTAAASAVMKTKGPKMAGRDFDPQGRVEQSAKDFNLILSSAEALTQDLPFARTYAAMMRDCMDNDEAGLDNAAIIQAIERSRPG